MKIRYIALVLATVPMFAFAATVRSAADRAGGSRVSVAMTKGLQSAALKKSATTTNVPTNGTVAQETDDKSSNLDADACREEYRTCMDEFCLLDESEGERCACSDNVRQAKNIIQEIQDIQAKAETLYTEGVEREKLGSRADWVFSATDKAQDSDLKNGLYEWMYGGKDAESLSADDEIGDNLYAMAAEVCEDVLARCDKKIASKEEQLYLREITKNCKAFDTFLGDQKRAAESNLKTAQAAVRSTRASMMSQTDKYNRGECLLAYRSCIADKGGCGVDFENCLDADLLGRRAHACENILDQCMRSRDLVLQDWEAEQKYVLDRATAINADNLLATCNAKTQNCLEERCSASTDVLCLNDIEVAAGICPIIGECDDAIGGKGTSAFKTLWKNKLASLRITFCQNDVAKCMQEKCGINYDAPQCTGQGANTIANLCPQKLFFSCNQVGTDVYTTLMNAVKLNLNYQQLENCVNYYADLMGRTCGMDMACLASSQTVMTYKRLQTGDEFADIEQQVVDEAEGAVEKFFKTMDKDATVKACNSVNGNSDAVAGATKFVAKERAKARYLAELEAQQLKLVRKASIKEAQKDCYSRFAVESRPSGEGSYIYISSVSFEPSLRNCHVCRKQRVCATGGKSKESGALEGAIGGVGAGASTGAMAGPWGAIILGAVGGIAGGVMGANATGEKTSCQEIESCEDINMGDVDDVVTGSSITQQSYTTQQNYYDR